MLKNIKVGGAVLNQTPLDWTGNVARIKEAIAKAKATQVSILCLPELCLSGYGCEDAFLSLNTLDMALQSLADILPDTQGIAVAVGLPLAYNNRVFNTAAMVVNGKVLGFVAKHFLANNGIHYEPRWFTAWEQGEVRSVRLPLDGVEQEYPIGDMVFELGGLKIGFEICEDAWVAQRPARWLYDQGVDVVLNPSASHFAFDKLETRKQFVLDASRSLGAVYVYANLIGNEAGRAIYDGGVMIAAQGKMLSLEERLTYHDVHLTTALCDIELGRLAQAQMSGVYHLPEENNQVGVDFEFTPAEASAQNPNDESWEHSDDIKEEEFARALALGMFDYMRKSFSKGFVISLSGGADSSSLLAVARLMLELAEKSIGMDGLKSKLSYIAEIQACETISDMAKILFHVAYQPTVNSSDTTLNAAKGLADGVGASFYVFDINAIVEGYKGIVSEGIGRELSWDTDDIALQNIQARVRAPSVWMMANIKGALLLSTSNRSEAAVGYATMDGDTSGGLSPIAGIDKHFLRHWLVWLETQGVDGTYRVPSLSAVNVQQPTAELRPPSSKQTDEKDLMPYDVLNLLEGWAIRDKKSPLDCLSLLQEAKASTEKETLKLWVRKFFTLWSRNQWKRERYAPSFHFDDRNLDPRSWCRFPILSGGFRKELEMMDAG